MANDIISDDGEVIEFGAVATIADPGMISVLTRAEIDTQIATARQYPRSISRAMNNILSLATLDEQTAEECIYALKRGGKPIRGPSIRLAEIIVTQWGNNRSGAQVVEIDRANKLIKAEGFFHDLESNSATKATVSRRISDKHGRIYADDMIIVTGNAACSIAKRNAILAGVPKGVWRKALDAAESLIRGDAKTLVERRDKAIKAFAHFGLSPEQVFQIMDVAGESDIDIDDLVTLRAIYASLRNGEQTVEELLRSKTGGAPAHKVVDSPLADSAPAATGEAEKPPAEAAKPAANGEADQKAKEADPAPAAAEGPAEAAKPATVDQSPEDRAKAIDAAYLRGEDAKAKGMTPKSMPKEFRENGREAEAEAWLAGFEGRDLRDPGEEG